VRPEMTPPQIVIAFHVTCKCCQRRRSHLPLIARTAMERGSRKAPSSSHPKHLYAKSIS
jgi:hypothetical protein